LGELPDTVAIDYENEMFDAGAWNNTPEQQGFRDEVLKAHLARTKSRKGPPQPDLTKVQLAPVEGTSVSMRKDAADAASRLLAAANADLKAAQAAGNSDARQTIRLTGSSGHRDSDHQRRLWLRYFQNNYYGKTRKARAAIPEGPHSAKAVSYMLDVFGLPNRIAAPGYSNHQGGIAIDFLQERTPGHPIENSYEPQAQKKWRATWFYDWLQTNATKFGFTQYIKEAWHWEYHPAAVSNAVGQTHELEQEMERPAGPYLGGFVHTFNSKNLPLKVSVFCSKSAASHDAVEVLVYAHGLLNPCPPVPKHLPEDFITQPPFRLGEIVNASNRPTILIVPFFDWKPRQRHALGNPANLNAVVAEALAVVAAIHGKPSVSLSNLILAGHSRAYDFLEPLAGSFADPQMRQGALANLSEVWALDATYACNVAAWMNWISSKPNLRVSILFRKSVPGARSGTADCGWQFYSRMKASGGRLNVVPLDPRVSHCDVPRMQLPALLGAPASFYGSPEAVSHETYEQGDLMTNLNFESELFSSYEPAQGESQEMEHFGRRIGHVMNLRHAGVLHGHHGHHSFRSGGRQGWRRRNRFGSGDSTQDPQSIGWAQNCLAQITGSQISQSGRMGHSTRRDIRRFQMQNQLQPTGRLDQDTLAALQQACDDGDAGDQGDGDNETGYSSYEFDRPPLHTAPPPVYTPRNCDNDKLPSPSGVHRGLTSHSVQCPTRANAQSILAPIIRNAVAMLDHTIAELIHARDAACRGEPLGYPNLREVTACWLKYKLGVCIDDPAAWTAGTFSSRSIAEVIRRLVRLRDLLASNEIVYVCEPTCDSDTTFAFTIPREIRPDNVVRCIPGTPDRRIHLCPAFWNGAHAPYREQTIIHEAVHLTHCAGGEEDTRRGVSIGSPECLAQFVLATNLKNLDPLFVDRCGFTNRCGTVPKQHFARNCGAKAGPRPKPVPDWRP
jgi:LAS superfamily LD-carboxypeptidase LdcB